MRLFSLIFTILSAASLMAQINEEMTVVLRDVRVHVIDAEGKPVVGLTVEDFNVKDNRQTREIDYFEEIRPVSGDVLQQESVEEVSRPNQIKSKPFDRSHKNADRFMVLMVQSANMTKGAFDRAIPALIDFVDNGLGSNDRVKIIQMDDSFIHLTGFTKDRALMKEALGKMRYKGVMYRALHRADEAVYSRIEDWLRMHPDSRDGASMLVRNAIAAKARLKRDHYVALQLNLLDIAQMMEEVDGAKSIYLVSGGSFIDVGGAGDTSNLSEELGAAMNRADVTIYSMLYRPTSPPFNRSLPNEIETGKRVSADNPENDYDAQKWLRMLREDSSFPPSVGGYSATNSTQVTLNTGFENNRHLETGPAIAAESTGGIFKKYYNTTDMTEHMKKMRNLSSYYYRLSYRLSTKDTGSRLNISLKNKERGWKLHYGKDYTPKRPFEKLSKEEQAMAVGARIRYSNKFRNDLNATFCQNLFKQPNGDWLTSVMVEMVAHPFPKKGLSINYAAMDNERNLLDITSTLLEEPPNSHKGKPANLMAVIKKNAPMGMYDVLMSDTKPRYVRYYLRNLDTGDVSFMEQEIPETPSGGAFSSDILVTTQKIGTVVALNHLRKLHINNLAEDDQKRIDLDPFWLKHKIFKPGLAGEIVASDPLWVYFHLTDSVKKLNKIKIFAETHDSRIQLPTKVVDHSEVNGGHHIYVEVIARDLKPGNYNLKVEVKNSATGQIEYQDAPLSITTL